MNMGAYLFIWLAYIRFGVNNMLDQWVIFAVISGIFVSLREMYIKKHIKQSPEVISFATRFFGSIVFIFIAYQGDIIISNIPVFVGITLLTVLITAFATVIRLRLIKEEDLSLTTPWLGAIPLFVVLWSVIIYHDIPNAASLLGIVLVCLGAFTINLQGKKLQMKKSSLWMLLIAGLLGLTTSVDKIAIGASSAITYSLIWTIASAALMYGVAKNKSQKVMIMDKHLIIQAVLWVAEFFFQMIAVQSVSQIASGPTYVKTLTMLNIVITTVISSLVFKEKERKKRILSAVMIFTGAVIVVLFR
ncbi:MAG: EamA family transporter [Mobilitalea sp.]